MNVPPDTFLPQTLNQWLAAAVIVLGWTFAVWRAYSKLSNDVNQVGERINKTETDCTKHGTEIVNLKLEQQKSADDRSNMRERISATETMLRTLGEELREERLAVMSTLHASEKAAAERDARTREELAAIKERLNIELLVKSVVRNLKAN